jgi:hypothetical protein
MNEELNIILKAKDEASKVVEDLSKKTEQSFAQIAKTVGTAMTIAGGAITGVLALTVKSAAEAERKRAQFDATLKNVEGTTDDVRKALIDAADATTKLGFDNEEAAVRLAQFYQRTGDVTEAIKLNNLAMDLSRAKNVDLATASQLITMAMSGAGRVLKQYGIEIKDSATPLEALGILHQKVGGQADAFAKTYAGSMEILQNRLGDLREQIGEAFLPMLTQLAGEVSDIITKVQEWAKAHPELFDKIVQFTAGAGLLALALGAVGMALPVIISGVTLLAGPVGIVIAGIGFLTAVMWELYQQGLLTREFLSTLIRTIEEKTNVISMAKAAWQVIVKMWNEMVMPALRNLWETLKPYVPYLQEFGKAIGITLVASFNILIALISGAVLGALFALTTALDGIDFLIKTVRGALESFGDGWRAIGEAVGWVVGKLEDLIEAAVRAASALGNVLNKSGAGGILGGIASGIGGIALGMIPKFATGGIVTQPTLAMVGEAGPEAIVPLRSGFGSGNITVNVNGGYYLSDDAARDMADKIVDRLKLQRRI